jgi:catechol 2,3-dioxygenase-like lactoylglutathione lyase family enzyme
VSLDHITLSVTDYAASRRFYEAAFAPLGYVPAVTEQRAAGFGPAGSPFFWIAQREPFSASAHIAVTASDRASVDAFHAAGVAAGGTDNGAPGLREQYSPDHYAAFVLDPDGNNIEAVCHTPA